MSLSLHYVKMKVNGKKDDVANKIDMSKAYDRIDWGFFELIMLKLGFDSSWVSLIMMCIRSVRYSIRVNDTLVGPLTPDRGLRQGYPLSSYLFILCTQGLSTLVEKAVSRGDLHGVKVCR